MPKATLCIGGNVSPTGLTILADAMHGDGLPIGDDQEDGDSIAYEPPDQADRREFYRNCLLAAEAADEPIVLCTWEAGDLIEGKAGGTIEAARGLGLHIRTFQPGQVDPDRGELVEAWITFEGPGSARRVAWVDGDGYPLLPIKRGDIANHTGFLKRFGDAVTAWLVVDSIVPPLNVL